LHPRDCTGRLFFQSVLINTNKWLCWIARSRLVSTARPHGSLARIRRGEFLSHFADTYHQKTSIRLKGKAWIS